MENNITIKRFGIIVDENLFDNNDGNNINGPSLIKVPEFIKKPLGKYYLYFAHHSGKYIRMAYSNNIIGPYHLYRKGVLHLNQVPGYGHLASPDVHINKEKEEIFMYYHCSYENNKTNQSTFCAKSCDGINFVSDNNIIIYPYFRYFKYKNNEYGIAMGGLKPSGGVIYKKINNDFEIIGHVLPGVRHMSILVSSDKIYLFYTIVGDTPEHIYMSNLDIEIPEVTDCKSLIKPEIEYEGSNSPLEPSVYGKAMESVNQLRDPFIYKENNRFFLFYTICGEKGIALCEIDGLY